VIEGNITWSVACLVDILGAQNFCVGSSKFLGIQLEKAQIFLGIMFFTHDFLLFQDVSGVRQRYGYAKASLCV